MKRSVAEQSVEKCEAKNFRTFLPLTIFRHTFFDSKHCFEIAKPLMQQTTYSRWSIRDRQVVLP